MANKSVLELAVGTGQWDAGLKKAQQTLNNFTQAQGGFQQALEKDNGDMLKFIQMMGKMDSTANTAKGQMNDYKKSLELLTLQYNNLSESQKRSVGPDLLNAIEAIKTKFIQARDQVKEFNQSIGEIKTPQIEMKGGEENGIGNMLAVFGGNMMTKAVGALTDLGQKALDVANQSAQMASAAEGVRLAFERIDDGTLLDHLREATHGTVNDLELMKAAVKFNDFKLPLDQLGTMLAFAQQKAKDTGQSVDYLVDSIVMGLGRKSLMILDNLGLSAAEIKDKMAETGDMTTAVGEIIREQMQNAGNYVETAADRTQRATAEMENAMLDLGVAIQDTFNISGGVEGFETFLRTDLARTLTDVVTWLGDVKTAITEIGTSNGFEAMCNVLDSLVIPKLTGITTQLRNIKAFIDGLTGAGSGKTTIAGIGQAVTGGMQGVIQKVKGAQPGFKVVTDSEGNVISATNAEGKDVTKEYKKNHDDANSVDNLIKKLRELESERKKAISSGDSELSKDLLKKINQTKQDIKGLDPNALTTTTTPKKITKKDTWSPIEMQSFDFRGITSFGRSEEAVQKDINKWQKIKRTTEDEDVRENARKMVEKFQDELKRMNSTDPTKGLSDAYTHDFSKDMEEVAKMLKKEDKEEKKYLSDGLGQLAGGLGGLQSGFEALGVDLGEGFGSVVSGLQGITTILTAIQAIITAIEAINAVDALIPLAGGGIVPKAAGGYFIPGNYNSADQIFAGNAWVNSGELVLNKAQQGNLASQLTAAERGNGQGGTPYVDGEKIFLGINNFLRRSGRGEIVTSR